MTMPIAFPDWMPAWLQLLVLALGVLLALAVAFMPFSVFGTKSRLESIEVRLDEIQHELRTLAARLPEPGREPFDTPTVLRASASLREPTPPPRTPPPIPPASWEAEPSRESLSPTLRAAARVSETVRERAEPRLSRKPEAPGGASA